MTIEDVKEDHFYLANVTYYTYFNHSYKVIKTVIKCTQIQHFPKEVGYINVHFKTCRGERIITYGSEYDFINRTDGVDLISEIEDPKLKNTTIIFIDSTHYKKEVNKNKYREYEI